MTTVDGRDSMHTMRVRARPQCSQRERALSFRRSKRGGGQRGDETTLEFSSIDSTLAPRDRFRTAEERRTGDRAKVTRGSSRRWSPLSPPRIWIPGCRGGGAHTPVARRARRRRANRSTEPCDACGGWRDACASGAQGVRATDEAKARHTQVDSLFTHASRRDELVMTSRNAKERSSMCVPTWVRTHRRVERRTPIDFLPRPPRRCAVGRSRRVADATVEGEYARRARHDKPQYQGAVIDVAYPRGYARRAGLTRPQNGSTVIDEVNRCGTPRWGSRVVATPARRGFRRMSTAGGCSVHATMPDCAAPVPRRFARGVGLVESPARK